MYRAQNSDISALKCCIEADWSRDNLALSSGYRANLPATSQLLSRKVKKKCCFKIVANFAITLFSRR